MAREKQVLCLLQDKVVWVQRLKKHRTGGGTYFLIVPKRWADQHEGKLIRVTVEVIEE